MQGEKNFKETLNVSKKAVSLHLKNLRGFFYEKRYSS
jgi:hypothetical protein